MKGGRPSVSQHAPVRTVAPPEAGLVGDGLGERRLADPRLAGQQEQPAPPALGVGEGPVPTASSPSRPTSTT